MVIALYAAITIPI